jgi:hypothetical protein
MSVGGTGHPIESDAKYVGSFQLKDGDFIFHLFEPV